MPGKTLSTPPVVAHEPAKVHVALIACCARKSPISGPACELYQGSLFKSQLQYARQVLKIADEQIFVVSALHGLVPLSQKLHPYSYTLSDMTVQGRLDWGRQCVADLLVKYPAIGFVSIMAGKLYRNNIVPWLDEPAIPWGMPHPSGLGLGQQLQWYQKGIL